MIAKIINTPVNFSSPFQYNESKIATGKGELLEKNFIGGSVSTFQETISSNKHVRNLKANLLHIAISPNDLDNMSKETLQEVAHEYLNRMGIDNNRPLLIHYHHDTAHRHIHILTTKINYDGKKINDSFLKYRSQAVSRNIEKDLGLTLTLENTKEEKNTLPELQGKKHNPNFKSEKNKIKNAIRQFVYFSDSLKELESKLQNNGFYIRKISNGKGLSYVFGVGEKYFKESQLGNFFSLANLQKRIEGKLTFTPEEQKKYLSQNINRVLKTSTTFKEFEKTLKKRGIEVIQHQNKGGIYGISFSQIGIDNAKEFKGSEIRRDLSYNKINTILSKNTSGRGEMIIKKEKPNFSQKESVKEIPDYFTPTHLRRDQEEEFPWRRHKKNKSK